MSAKTTEPPHYFSQDSVWMFPHMTKTAKTEDRNRFTPERRSLRLTQAEGAEKRRSTAES